MRVTRPPIRRHTERAATRRRRWDSFSSELFLHRHVSTTQIDDVISTEPGQTSRSIRDDKAIRDQ